jgi:hypothetical protein
MDPFMIPTDPPRISGWTIHVFPSENGIGVRAYGTGTRQRSQAEIDQGQQKWEKVNVAQIDIDSPMDEASTVHAVADAIAAAHKRVAELQREARERREKEGPTP